MAATPSIKVVKSMGYRGGTQLWSNRYHMNGGTVASQAHLNTLADNVSGVERQTLPSYVSIVEVIYYNAGSDVPVYSKSYSLAGNMVPANAHTQQAGDVCGLIRWATPARSSKNHPVYLFNYMHGVYREDTTNDQLEVGQSGDFLSYANNWLSGFSDGVNTYVRAGPNGVTASGVEVETYLTHRDFPR